jgi:hypothetical protein
MTIAGTALMIYQPIEWQRIGNQIDAAFVFARSDFVGVDRRLHQRWTFNHFFIAVRSTKEPECTRWEEVAA